MCVCVRSQEGVGVGVISGGEGAPVQMTEKSQPSTLLPDGTLPTSLDHYENQISTALIICRECTPDISCQDLVFFFLVKDNCLLCRVRPLEQKHRP